jgi:hypothetical protein
MLTYVVICGKMRDFSKGAVRTLGCKLRLHKIVLVLWAYHKYSFPPFRVVVLRTRFKEKLKLLGFHTSITTFS